MSAGISSRLVYVVPVHNEEHVLESNVARLGRELAKHAESKIYLVENGSRDRSWEICKSLAKQGGVEAFQEQNAGIGYAYHRGLEEALRAFGPAANRWAVLTAADLPFGFSDLVAAEKHIDRPSSRIFIGSKAHPDSVVNRGVTRSLMTFAYRSARKLVIGLDVGDSQGSIFLRLDLAAALLPRIGARGFFYSTELCHFAARARERILELPIVLEDESQRSSTVRPWKHGKQMLAQLWELRQRSR